MAQKNKPVEAGDPIYAETFNELISSVNEARIEDVAPPLALSRGPGGSILWLASDLLETSFAKSGGSGVPALTGTTPGFADVVLYSFDGTSLTAGDTVKAFNPSTTAVGANKWLILLTVQGSPVVIVEAC
jgi:hypothetical protein